MSKESAFLAVYPALAAIQNHTDVFLTVIESHLQDEEGQEKTNRQSLPPDWASLNLDWLNQALDDCPVEVLEMGSFEEHLRLAIDYVVDASSANGSQLALMAAEESLAEGLEAIALFIDSLAAKVFGYWGSFFFSFAAKHLPEDCFDPRGYDPGLLWEIDQSRYPEEPGCTPDTIKPLWNKELSKLFWGTTVIRRVRPTVAKNVVAVLDEFQEEEWRDRIDYPLDLGGDPQRLHETLKRLNQGLTMIRFRADGKGKGIVWERV